MFQKLRILSILVLCYVIIQGCKKNKLTDVSFNNPADQTVNEELFFIDSIHKWPTIGLYFHLNNRLIFSNVNKINIYRDGGLLMHIKPAQIGSFFDWQVSSQTYYFYQFSVSEIDGGESKLSFPFGVKSN